MVLLFVYAFDSEFILIHYSVGHSKETKPNKKNVVTGKQQLCFTANRSLRQYFYLFTIVCFQYIQNDCEPSKIIQNDLDQVNIKARKLESGASLRIAF